ncbi:MAG: bifunctional riboflavin kinase/FAD synthetase [Deltaproteobacteria bacterium]|nr:bifunctional riboflavin kinase/FAD synthetase [Deltaproteobacteria bacterium]
MKVYRGVEGLEGKFNSPALTLGNFDGVHRGHRKIFKQLRSKADEMGGEAVIFTFDPHPVKVLRPDEGPSLISPLPEKLKLLEESAVDAVILADFTRAFAEQHPAQFVREIIHERIKAGHVIVGHDFTFGKGKEGTIGSLKLLGEELGFHVEVIAAVKLDGQIVSSTRIRELIRKGDVKEAAKLLGRCHYVTGEVIEGHGRGKPLGFPTANLDYRAELIPEDGVYAAKAEIEGKMYGGATNVGTNPTFGDEKRSVETYIFDFNESLYGKTMKVSFVERIRGEIAFSSPHELAGQIKRDISKVKTALNRADH